MALEPWAVEPGEVLGPLDPQGGPLQQSYPSQMLTVTHTCGTSLFHIPTPPYQS